VVARSKFGKWRVGYAGTQCPRCKTFKRHEDIRTGSQTCTNCGGEFEAVRFDPVTAVVVVPQLAGVGPAEAAPCAWHARNQAVASCSRCGKFMCSLCKIDADGAGYCPSCFDRLSTEGLIPGGALRVKNWSGLAASCIFGSPFVWFLSWILIPMGMYFSIQGIKDKKAREEQDGLVRLYVLLAFGIIALVLLVLGVAAMFGAVLMRGK